MCYSSSSSVFLSSVLFSFCYSRSLHLTDIVGRWPVTGSKRGKSLACMGCSSSIQSRNGHSFLPARAHATTTINYIDCGTLGTRSEAEQSLADNPATTTACRRSGWFAVVQYVYYYIHTSSVAYTRPVNYYQETGQKSTDWSEW